MEERAHASAAEFRFQSAVKMEVEQSLEGRDSHVEWKRMKERSGEKAAGSSVTYTHLFRMPGMLACAAGAFHAISSLALQEGSIFEQGTQVPCVECGLRCLGLVLL